MPRIETTGHVPFIEFRPSVGKHFVVFPSLGMEMAPAFMFKVTAHEIATNSMHGTPFFQMIPLVPYRSPYPRPGLIMPKLVKLDLEYITRDYDD